MSRTRATTPKFVQTVYDIFRLYRNNRGSQSFFFNDNFGARWVWFSRLNTGDLSHKLRSAYIHICLRVVKQFWKTVIFFFQQLYRKLFRTNRYDAFEMYNGNIKTQSAFTYVFDRFSLYLYAKNIKIYGTYRNTYLFLFFCISIGAHRRCFSGNVIGNGGYSSPTRRVPKMLFQNVISVYNVKNRVESRNAPWKLTCVPV